jgi:hypothetical protein
MQAGMSRLAKFFLISFFGVVVATTLLTLSYRHVTDRQTVNAAECRKEMAIPGRPK